MNASITVRNAEQYQTSVWSGGTTTQLFIYPEDGDYKEGTFQARISSATVELQKIQFHKPSRSKNAI
ncbi:MAG: HutD family protein [Blautia sp.]